jgi:hypothetical protein
VSLRHSFVILSACPFFHAAKLRQRAELLRGELQRVVGLREEAEGLRDRLQRGEDAGHVSSEGAQWSGKGDAGRQCDQAADSGQDGANESSEPGAREQDTGVTLGMTDLDGCVEQKIPTTHT